jgi:transposase-like protein
MKERITLKHKVYTIEEKNEIVKEYIEGKIRRNECLRKYDISNNSVLNHWKKQYLKYGTTIDNRGKGSKGKGNFNKSKRINPEEMTREELIEYVKAVEDIKKVMVCLNKQKKNTK